jgi:hypothetical protein
MTDRSDRSENEERTVTTPKPEWVKDRYGTSYEELVDGWGYEVVTFDTIGSYEGDHFVVLRDGERYGWVVFGYGSCSGCDELEAAAPWNEDGDWTEVVKLSDELRAKVEWHDLAAALADRLAALERGNEWWLNDSEGRDARDRAVAALRSDPAR